MFDEAMKSAADSIGAERAVKNAQAKADILEQLHLGVLLRRE